MIACDRCRKRVTTTNALRSTYAYWNEMQVFTPTRQVCGACADSWQELRDNLIKDIETYTKCESDRRMAEWMSSRDVTHDPWSEVSDREGEA